MRYNLIDKTGKIIYADVDEKTALRLCKTNKELKMVVAKGEKNT
jgi:hypothetical protein